jgi:hypothetical protein
MIVLQEIDCSDSDKVLSDDQSADNRHVKSIAASGPVPTASAIMSQPSHAALAQTASPTSANVSVDSSETDSAVSMSELAPIGSDSVDLQERTAPDEVVLNLIAHSGHASAQVCSLNCMRTLVFVCRTYHSFRLFSFFCAHDIASTHMFFQPTITGELSAASLSSTLNDMHRALLERDRENEQLRQEIQQLRLQLATSRLL